MQEQCQVQTHGDELIIGICQNSECKQQSRKVCKLCLDLHKDDPDFQLEDIKQFDQLSPLIQEFKANIQKRTENITKQCQIHQYFLLQELNAFMDFWHSKYSQWDYVEQTLKEITDKYRDLSLDSYLNYQDKKINLEQYLSQSSYDSFNEIDQILNGHYYNHIPSKVNKPKNDLIQNFKNGLKQQFEEMKYKNRDHHEDLLQFLVDQQKIEQNIPNIYEKFRFCFGVEENEQIIERINQIQTNDILRQDKFYQKQICRKGTLLKHIGRIDESLKYFDDLIKLTPSNTYAYSNKAYILEEQGNLKQALECLDQCIETNPNHLQAYEQKADMLRHQNYQEALECWDLCIKVNPNNGDAYKNKAQLLRDEDEQIKCLDLCNKVNPNYLEAYEKKAVLLKKQKSIKVEYMDKCIRYNPYQRFPYELKFLYLAQKGDYEEAIECLDLCLKKNPNFIFAWEYKASYQMSQDKKQEALQSFNELIKINPEHEDAYKEKGPIYNLFQARLLYLLGNSEQAIECWDIYLKLNPNNGYAYDDKTKIFLEQKNYEGAIECLNQCIKHDPSHQNAYKTKAGILYEQKNYQEAIETLQLFLKEYPTSFYYNDVKGELVKLKQLIENKQSEIQQNEDVE